MLLEKFAPKKKKIGQPAKKGRKKKEKKPWAARAEKGGKKNPGINPRQPAGKGREKKTLVLTLGSPPEKGQRNKPKKKKKNPGINHGQRHLKYTEVGSAIENAKAGSAIECKARTVTSQTDRHTNAITILNLKEC
jgi:hypothetical protein